LNQEVVKIGDEVMDEIEKVEDTKGEVQLITIIGAVWIVVITLLLALVITCVCLRMRRAKRRSSDSDAEFAIDAMSDKSSVVDFDDIEGLADVFGHKKKNGTFSMPNGDTMHDIVKAKKKKSLKEKDKSKKEKENIKANFRTALMNNGGKPWSGFYFPDPGNSKM